MVQFLHGQTFRGLTVGNQLSVVYCFSILRYIKQTFHISCRSLIYKDWFSFQQFNSIFEPLSWCCNFTKYHLEFDSTRFTLEMLGLVSRFCKTRKHNCACIRYGFSCKDACFCKECRDITNDDWGFSDEEVESLFTNYRRDI